MRLAAAVLLLALCVLPAPAQGTGEPQPAPAQAGPPAQVAPGAPTQVAPGAPTQVAPGAPVQDPPAGAVQDPPAAQAKAAPPKQASPIVRSIVVEGEQRYSEAQLVGALGQKLGQPYDAGVVDRGLTTLWTSFSVRANVFVRDLPGENGAPSHEIELRLVVVEMPSDREPRFIGNVDIDTKTLKRWALLEDRVELFEYQANRVRQRLLEGYRREGYYWIEVDVVTRDARDDPNAGGTPLTDVIFEIREGPKVRVKDLDVLGNQSMPDGGWGFWKSGLSAFSKRELGEPSLFNWWGSPFVEETLDADLVAMRNVYRERGWLDAVVEAQPLIWNDDHSEVRIKIVIDEGRPYVVEKLDIAFYEWVRDPEGQWQTRRVDGPTRFTAEQLLQKLREQKNDGLRPGKRYENVLRKRDETTLRDLYGAEGHLSHPSLPVDMRWQFLEPDLLYLQAEHKLDVTYRIVEAHPLRLREVSFAGTHHTRDEVLRREVGVFPGGIADQKEINKSLNRIQGTEFFSDPSSPQTHVEPTYRFIAVEGSRDLVDLEYQVEEGRVVEFQLQGGIDSNEGAFGLISLTMKNFDWRDAPSKWNRSLSELFRKEALHGAGQRVDIAVSPGTLSSYARFHYLDPDVFSRYLEPISLDFELRRALRREPSHDEDRFDKYLKLGRRFGFDTFAAVGVVHSDLDVSDLDNSGVPASLQRQNALGETVLSGFSFDVRTQFGLDNLINPHRGAKLSLRNTLFTELLSSDFEYLRSELGTDFYFPTGTKADGTEHVFHIEVDGGIMPTYGSTDEVPYSERFKLGGSNLRGFARRGAGKRGVDVLGAPTEFAAGGESYLSGTVEWLYPLYSITQAGTYRQIESLRGVLFFDWGVLGQDAFDIDPNELRTSVGFGIGLAYPLPIQLNFGYPIRKYPGDERQTFSFSIGINF